MTRTFLFFTLLLVSPTLSYVSQAQTPSTPVHLRTDPKVRKVIIEYELPAVQPDDSVYVELLTASGRIVRPMTVTGDVGKAVKAGKTQTAVWDAVADNVKLNEDVTVLLRIGRATPVIPAVTTRPAPNPAPAVVSRTGSAAQPAPAQQPATPPPSVVRKRFPWPIVGWVATAGLGGYGYVLYNSINNDVDTYRQTFGYDNPNLKPTINRNKTIFYGVAGLAAAVTVVNVLHLIRHKPRPARVSLVLPPDAHVTSVGLGYRF